MYFNTFTRRFLENNWIVANKVATENWNNKSAAGRRIY